MSRFAISCGLLLLASTPLFADDSAALKGAWQCQEEGGPYSLEFQGEDQLIYNGQPTRYQLSPGILMVEEEYGPVGYFYQLQEGVLSILSPDGSVSQCRKQAAGAKPPRQAKQPSRLEAPAQATGQPQAVVPGVNWPVYARPQGATWSSSDPQALVYKFAGRWDKVSSNTLHNIYLKPDGSYEDSYEAGYSGTFSDQGGYQTGAWGVAGAEQGGGYWTIQGTLERGVITLVGRDGRRTVLNYRIHVRNGEYYNDEYFFNGEFYTVKYIYR